MTEGKFSAMPEHLLDCGKFMTVNWGRGGGERKDSAVVKTESIYIASGQISWTAECDP